MQNDIALANWLRLTLIPGIGGETQRRLLRAFGDPDCVFQTSRSALRAVISHRLSDLLLDTETSAGVEAALDWARQSGHALITLGDPEYPPALLEICDPPSVIYVRGRVELLSRPILAIVGSRNPTPQGVQNAESFANALAQAGLVIASGLALGIDTAAHRGALAAGGNTIAFVGTGIDRIYPASNQALAHKISELGCIVSEFLLGTPAIASNFPRRNRLISGIARGTLVVEAAMESGSLITARLAADQGRDVFAIPGSIHSPQSRGCHKLIKQGAKLVETVQDVLDELSWSPFDTETAADCVGVQTNSVEDPLLEHIGFDPCSLDNLALRSGLTIDVLLARIIQLEIQGHLATLPGGDVQRLLPH